MSRTVRSVGLVASALLVVSCGSSSTTTSSSSSSANPVALNFNSRTISWLAANTNASGTPHSGGTLKIVGNSDNDHLDTAAAYVTTAVGTFRAITRQLYTYPANTDLDVAYKAVPDIAADMPSISADRKTYTITLRTDVMWNTSPPRPVTSKDVLFGFKRLCNPVAPVGAPTYYTATIVGFKAYCDGLSQVSPDVPSLQNYMSSHPISGITTPDSSTIGFSLLEPAPDFVDILAMTFSSPAPAEYANYLPDSADLHNHWISDGPYTVTAYTPAQEWDLGKNPVWTKASDPVRNQYVDKMQIILGQTEVGIQQQLEAGSADMGFETTVPTASLPGLTQPQWDPRLGIFPTPDLNPLVTFNLQSPNAGSAMANPKVRQALEYTVDKLAIAKIFGGSITGQPQNHIIPPGSTGYQDFNPYPTANNQGDPAKCKQMLAAAGVSNLTLKENHSNGGQYVSVFTELQKDFAACGVTLNGTASSYADLFGLLTDGTKTKAGAWDLALDSALPDWHGDNGRSLIEASFDGRSYGTSADYGDYNSATSNALIDKALAATSPAQAASLWHQVDVQIMNDAPVIPLRSESTAILRSTRVHNAIFYPSSSQYDYTQVWLSS